MREIKLFEVTYENGYGDRFSDHFAAAALWRLVQIAEQKRPDCKVIDIELIGEINVDESSN